MSDRLDPEVAARLEREPLAWLCTLRGDGSPHLTPVWFVFHDSPDLVARFKAKYDWDITVSNEREGVRVLMEIPVERWLLAGVAQ
ncbi:pyridoxamine 5'-phosphate oxidase family protein [Symbioplanes lichenis]|uniref:pyridoxamine 5'-phosphate oxidase family protein n=1 Tax=Symbioplanes lichenis TaxID=1629072 RepID=UPI0027399CCC|nr:pyridoxamine 5'-phosphate oxidase family protein [Actinoplanes lichenis]